jgi:hypothetical protein
MSKRPSKAQIARELGVDAAVFHRNVLKGCPTYSIEAAAAWRAQHVRPRVKPLAAASDHPPVAAAAGVSPADRLMAARTAEALARSRRAEAEAARIEARSIDAAALLSALRAWRAGFGAAAARTSASLEAELRSALGERVAAEIGLRRAFARAELAIENLLMSELLQHMRQHLPALAAGIDRNLGVTRD